MELTVNLAGTNISITFVEEAKKAIHFCYQYFKGFLVHSSNRDAEITVSLLKKPESPFPFRTIDQRPVFEQRLHPADVAAWLAETPGYNNDFPINESTICAFCLDGLLLFDPTTVSGRMYLLKQGVGCFRPLYRLFWMVFAQVLGEARSCFIHGAALVKDQQGYLFLGDSGAGKSTLAGLSRACTILSDDGPIVREKNGGLYLFASPYHQLGLLKGLKRNAAEMNAKLKGFYFLNQDDQIYLENISKKRAISSIINRHIHFFPYLSTHAKAALFDLFFQSCHRLPTYNLHFCQDQEVFSIIAQN